MTRLGFRIYKKLSQFYFPIRIDKNTRIFCFGHFRLFFAIGFIWAWLLTWTVTFFGIAPISRPIYFSANFLSNFDQRSAFSFWHRFRYRVPFLQLQNLDRPFLFVSVGVGFTDFIFSFFIYF